MFNQLRPSIRFVAALLLLASLGGCGQTAPAVPASADVQVLRSDVPRQTAPTASAADMTQVVADNSAFAFDMYGALRDADGNLFFSPYSVSQALAMTYAGAQDTTAQQMAATLHVTLPPAQLHPAFNALALQLDRYGDAEQADAERRFQLSVANAPWGQRDYPFRQPFLDTLAEHYGAAMQIQDFKTAPEAARQAINTWVAQQTEDKIVDLLPSGSIDNSTRLVLTNAIYFNARWQSSFKASDTRDGAFTLLDDSRVTVPLMTQSARFRYAAGDEYQAVALPYAVPGDDGGVSMLILLPKEGQFAAFEQALDAQGLDAIIADLALTPLDVTMPKWEFTSDSVSLKQTLVDLGMPVAFDPRAADFGGMADGQQTGENLYIDDVFHKAFVKVDEDGTEAAAATGVIIAAESAAMPNQPLRIDRPFIFLIRDEATGSVLFLGRVVDPR